MSMLEIAKSINDEDADKILANPENFPKDWVREAEKRLNGR